MAHATWYFHRDSHVTMLIGTIFAFLTSKYVYSVIFINVAFANFRIFIFNFLKLNSDIYRYIVVLLQAIRLELSLQIFKLCEKNCELFLIQYCDHE